MRTAAQCVGGLGPGWRPIGGSGTADAAAQIPEIGMLPAFATTRTTEMRPVGGRTDVEP